MDSLKPASLLVVLALVDGTFWTGFIDAVNGSDIPHNSSQLGGVLASALLVLSSQVIQWWQNRRALAALVEQHLGGSPPAAKPTRKRPKDAV